jgi:hypothetical protein
VNILATQLFKRGLPFYWVQPKLTPDGQGIYRHGDADLWLFKIAQELRQALDTDNIP